MSWPKLCFIEGLQHNQPFDIQGPFNIQSHVVLKNLKFRAVACGSKEPKTQGYKQAQHFPIPQMSKQISQLTAIRKELRKFANPDKAKILSGFFKTGKGEYGEGDVFLGVMVPQIRLVSKKFSYLSLADLQRLLRSKVHEERLLALIILVSKFQKAEEKQKRKIFDFYLKHTAFINNWDLVDLSAEYIVGAYLEDKDKSILVRLAKSANIWERRIAMLSTFCYIKQGQSGVAFKIAEILLTDKHDLIQKAVGWMLREIGKKCSEKEEIEFLKRHYRQMPRTMLRYAIERFDQKTRNGFLQGLI